MEIKKSFIVDQPIEKVWDLLANRFGAACDWVTGLYHSEAFNDPQLDGAPANNRACQTNQGDIVEEILVFDAGDYHLAYAVVEGFPSFVKTGVNNWRLKSQGDKTQVDIHFIAELQGILGTVMAPMMKWQLGKVFEQATIDFKHFAETGRPSPTKQKEIDKRAKKAIAA